jgi:HD-GYP domain-containing protein (c-di-GMP phosphodiesterase class II)
LEAIKKMDTVPLPLELLAVGKPIPVNVWSSAGQLLLRKGQPLASERDRERLRMHQAVSTAHEAMAWQRAFERMVYEMLRNGVKISEIARVTMPSEILERDYVEEEHFKGGWLDLQEVLRGVLYHGGLSVNPPRRLAGIEAKVLELLQADPDDSLFCLLQTLPHTALGYCATHALLCGVMCELTGLKLGLDAVQRRALLGAALTMNISMALEQDEMAVQDTPLTEEQRALVRAHPQKSAELLAGMGMSDEDLLDIVRWHHAPDSPEALPRNLLSRRILRTADVFVAKMAARKTRAPLSPLDAVKSIYSGTDGGEAAVSSAMAAAVGFFPPGSYVELANGEIAVVVQRGARANTPWIISLIDKNGLPQTQYQCRNTAEAAHAIKKPISFRNIRQAINLERVRAERAKIPR